MSYSTRFQPNPDAQLRAAEWATLEAQGWQRVRIAEAYGVARSTVTRAIDGMLAKVQAEAADVLRQRSGERLRVLIEKCFDELDKPHPIVRDGNRYDDVTDIAAVAALIREARRLDESWRRLWGLDAPTRRVVEIIGDDAVDAAIRQLEAEMAEQEAIGAARDRDRSVDGEAPTTT